MQVRSPEFGGPERVSFEKTVLITLRYLGAMIVLPVDITLAMLLRWVNLYVCAINSTDNSWKSFFL
jgi:hypothetical protein